MVSVRISRAILRELFARRSRPVDEPGADAGRPYPGLFLEGADLFAEIRTLTTTYRCLLAAGHKGDTVSSDGSGGCHRIRGLGNDRRNLDGRPHRRADPVVG